MWLKVIAAGVFTFAVLSEAAPPHQNLHRQEIPKVVATVTSSAQFESQTSKICQDGAYRDIPKSGYRSEFDLKARSTEEDLLSLKPTVTKVAKSGAMPTPSLQPLVNARHHRRPNHEGITKYPYTSVVRTTMTSATYDHTDEEGRTTRSYVLSATMTWANPWTTTVYSAECETCDYTDPGGRYTLTRHKTWQNTRYPPWRDPDKERTPRYKPWKESRTDIPYITPGPHRTRKYIEASTIPKEGVLTTATRYAVYVSAPSRRKPKWRTTTLRWKETFTKYPSTYTESEVNNVVLRAAATPTSHLQNSTFDGNLLKHPQEPKVMVLESLVVQDPARKTSSTKTDSRTFTKGQVVTTRHDTSHVIVTYEYTDSKGRVTSQETTTKVRSYKYSRWLTTTIESNYHWPKKTSSSDSTKALSPRSKIDPAPKPTQTPRRLHAIDPLPEGVSPPLPHETCEFHLDPTDMASLVARHKIRKEKSKTTSKYVTTWHWLPPKATKTFWFTIPEPTSKQTGTKTSITTWYWTTWLEPVTTTTSHGWWNWKESSTITTWWWTAPPSHSIKRHFAHQVEETGVHRAKRTTDGLPIESEAFQPKTMTYDTSEKTSSHSNLVPTNQPAPKFVRDQQLNSIKGDTSIQIIAPEKTYTYTDVVRSITETITFPQTTLTFWSPNDLPKSAGDSHAGAVYPRDTSDSENEKLIAQGKKSSSKASNRPGMTTQTRYFGGYTSTLSWWPSSLDTTWIITRQPPPTETPEAIKRHLAVDEAMFVSGKSHYYPSPANLPPLSVVLPVDEGISGSPTPAYTWEAPVITRGPRRKPSPSIWNWGTETTTQLPWWIRKSKLPWWATWVAGRAPQPQTRYATTNTVYIPATKLATRTLTVDSYSTADAVIPRDVGSAAKRENHRSKVIKTSARRTVSKKMPPCCAEEMTRGGDLKFATTTITYNVIRTTFHTRIPYSWTTTTWTFPRPTASSQKWPNKPRPTPPPGYNYWSNTPPSTKRRTSAWDPSTETDDDYLVARDLKTSHIPHATQRKHRTFSATNRPYVITMDSAYDWPTDVVLPSLTITETIPYIPWDRKRPTSEPWPRKSKPVEHDTWPRLTTRTRTVSADLPLFSTSTWLTTITPRIHGLLISGWSAYEKLPENSATRLTWKVTLVDTIVRATKTVTWLDITRDTPRPQRTHYKDALLGRAQDKSSSANISEGTKTFVTESIVTIQPSNPTLNDTKKSYPEKTVPLGREPFIVDSLPAPTPTRTWRPEDRTYDIKPAPLSHANAEGTSLSEQEREEFGFPGKFEEVDSAGKHSEHLLEDTDTLTPTPATTNYSSQDLQSEFMANGEISPSLEDDQKAGSSETETEDGMGTERYFLENSTSGHGDDDWVADDDWVEE